MATVTKFQIPTARVPRAPAENATGIAMTLAVASGDCPQNDNIALFVPPAGAQIVGAILSHDGTLGASCTAQLRIGTTTLMGASTAGGASSVVQNAGAAAACDGTNAVNVLIAGAAIAASTNLRVSLMMILPRG
jgi:hypothetical protein